LAKFTGSDSASLVEQLKDKDREISLLTTKIDELVKQIQEWEAKEKSVFTCCQVFDRLSDHLIVQNLAR